MRKVNVNSLVLGVLGVLFSSVLTMAAENDLIGVWVDASQTPVYEFIAGFKPNSGIALKFQDGQAESVSKWSIEGTEIKIGYTSLTLKIENEVLYLDQQSYAKSQATPPQEMLLALKENPTRFVEQLTQTVWVNPEDRNNTSMFILGFTPDSGIYRTIKKDNEELYAWSVANEVLKIGSDVYPNAKMVSNYLLLVDSYDNFHLFQRGEVVPALARIDLQNERDQFLDLLTRGTWKSGLYLFDKMLYEFRPTLGDLSGSVFVYRGTTRTYETSQSWEYSPKTGILKWNYTEYLQGKVIGDYLLLQRKNGETFQFARLSDSSEAQESHAKSKKLVISERDVAPLKDLLSRQWIKYPYYYTITFDADKPQGFLHEFRSIPFVIAGNTLKIESTADINELWQWENKVIFGDNKFSLQIDTSPVYLSTVDEEQALATSEAQTSALETLATEQMVLVIELKDGKTVTIPVPVKDFMEIQSLRIQPK